jgi:hypothetical protein
MLIMRIRRLAGRSRARPLAPSCAVDRPLHGADHTQRSRVVRAVTDAKVSEDDSGAVDTCADMHGEGLDKGADSDTACDGLDKRNDDASDGSAGHDPQ